MDRERADFSVTLEQIVHTLSDKAVPVALPIGQEAGFAGVVDLVTKRAYRFDGDAARCRPATSPTPWLPK